MHGLFVSFENAEHLLVLGVFKWSKFIHYLTLLLEVAYSVWFELVLSIVFWDLLAEAEMEKRVLKGEFGEEIAEISFLELSVSKGKVLLDDEYDWILRINFTPKSLVGYWRYFLLRESLLFRCPVNGWYI